MLFLSSKIGDTDILGIASMLLESTPAAIQSSYKLISLIPPGANSWEVRLRVARALLLHDQSHLAERIIENLDVTEYIRNVQNVDDVKSLFNLLPYVQQPEITLESLDFVASNNIFDQYSLIELKLKVANFFILIGKSDAAAIILNSISYANITNQEHLNFLGLYYIHLSKFKTAMDVFNFAERKEIIHHPHFFVFKGVNQFCLNDIEKAKATIDTKIEPKRRTVLNMFWQAKLCNYAGQHDEAYFWIETLLDDSSDFSLVQKCFCRVEKGNTLRSLGKIDEALQCYREAVENDIGALHWLWIAYFEYAMTLIYLGRVDDSLSIAVKGCKCKSYRYNSKYNPCSILSAFLSLRLSQLTEASVQEWADCACLWLFPYMPYKIWMLVLTGIALEEKRFHYEARNVYNKILKMDVCVSEDQVNAIPYLEENVFCFHDRNLMDILRSRVWPNDFIWDVFKRLIGIR